MRIGVEGRTLQGRRYGVARYLVNLLRNLVDIDEANEYAVYLSEPIEPLGFTSAHLEEKVIAGGPSLTWRHLRLPRAMKADGIDLHFSPSYFLPLYEVCPSVVVVHDLTFRAHPEWFARDWRMRFDDIFWHKVKKADHIITVSEYSKADIIELLKVDRGRVTAIPEAADEYFRPVEDQAKLEEVREKFGVPAGFVFTVGAIHTRRNLAEFSPTVDIHGAAARCGLSERVRHVEYVTEEDLLLLYNACGLFAYTSLYEGFGLPVIEAMACGAPVVCSNVTSIPEVAGDAALYFNPEITEEIGEVIASALSDATLRDRLGKAGIERAAGFSWRRTATETLGVFNKVLG